jgi:hypothetical protein
MSAYQKKNRTHPTNTVGDQVRLNTQNIKLSLPATKKFHPNFIGPLTIIELVGPVAARLQFPTHWKRIHNVFRVSLLRRYKPDGKLAFVPPAAFLQEGERRSLSSHHLAFLLTRKKLESAVSFSLLRTWVQSSIRGGEVRAAGLSIASCFAS